MRIEQGSTTITKTAGAGSERGRWAWVLACGVVMACSDDSPQTPGSDSSSSGAMETGGTTAFAKIGRAHV